MTVNTKTNLTVNRYTSTTPPDPSDTAAFAEYLLRELQALQNTMVDLVDGLPQVTDTAPINPRVGTVRYAIGTWATALGAVGLYVKKTSAWTLIV